MWGFVYHERPSQQAALIHPLLNWTSLMGSVWTKEPEEKGAMPVSALARGWGEQGIQHPGMLQNQKEKKHVGKDMGHNHSHVCSSVSACLPSALHLSPQTYCKTHRM